MGEFDSGNRGKLIRNLIADLVKFLFSCHALGRQETVKILERYVSRA